MNKEDFCNACHGGGKIQCDKCRQGLVSCPFCDGTGRRKTLKAYTLARLREHAKAEVQEHEKMAQTARHEKEKQYHRGQAEAYKHMLKHLDELASEYRSTIKHFERTAERRST